MHLPGISVVGRAARRDWSRPLPASTCRGHLPEPGLACRAALRWRPLYGPTPALCLCLALRLLHEQRTDTDDALLHTSPWSVSCPPAAWLVLPGSGTSITVHAPGLRLQNVQKAVLCNPRTAAPLRQPPQEAASGPAAASSTAWPCIPCSMTLMISCAADILGDLPTALDYECN